MIMPEIVEILIDNLDANGDRCNWSSDYKQMIPMVSDFTLVSLTCWSPDRSNPSLSSQIRLKLLTELKTKYYVMGLPFPKAREYELRCLVR